MKESITIKLNVWVICAILLIINLITIGLWQPWNNKTISRTLVITGSTTIEAAPDQFTFRPYYQTKGTNKTKLNTELSDLSGTIVAKLKELGVKDSAIKTDAYSYDYGIYKSDDNTEITANLSLTITLKDKSLAQKVQDYLATTSPLGSITPQNSFSIAKQKELEAEARKNALNDAKIKAENSTKQLGATLGKVIKINDNYSSGVTPLPWMMYSTNTTRDSMESTTYTIQPGLNEYSFSVEVTYELK